MDIPYYILGYGRDVYMKYGDYEHRAKNRSRFILDQLGEDAFRKAVRDAVEKARQEGIPEFSLEEEPALPRAAPTIRSFPISASASRNKKASTTSNTSP